MVATPRWLVFRVRHLRCALPVTDVVETMRPLPIEPVTGAPAAVLGLAVIRGEPLPVLDVAALLAAGEGTVEDATARFVTVRTGGRQVALAVDEVVGVEPADVATRPLPPLFADASAVSALGARDADLLVVLRAARLWPEGMPGATR